MASDASARIFSKGPLIIRRIFTFLLISFPPLLCHAHTPDSSATPLKRDTVTAAKDGGETIDVSNRQIEFGFADDVNEILFLRPGVARLAEAGSVLLIKGDGPFENRYMVHEVPMFSASHFGGHSFADQSGIMILSLKSASIVTRNIAGCYADIPGGVIGLEPGICRLGNPRWLDRPELAVNIGTLNREFHFSWPMRTGRDFYQLSAGRADDQLIFWKNHSSQSPFSLSRQAELGYAVPESFGDVTLSGQTTLKRVTVREHAWFAYDAYGKSVHTDGETVPWGMGAVSVADTVDGMPVKVNIGGSHQNWYGGKRMGPTVPLKTVTLTNCAVFAGIEKISLSGNDLDFSLRGEILDWRGKAVTRWNATDGVWVNTGSPGDTLPLHSYPVAPGPQYRLNAAEVDTVYEHVRQDGKEGVAALHAGWRRSEETVSYGANLLFGGVIPSGQVYLDPGIWGRVSVPAADIEANVGIQTSRPDIRGLPPEDYRTRLIRTYRGAVSARRAFGKWSLLNAESYVKWRDHSPREAVYPWQIYWDESRATPLFARGIDVDWKVNAGKRLSVTLLQNFSWSDRVENGNLTNYEWHVPWSTRLICCFRPLPERIHVYTTGVVCAGIPYRDLGWLEDIPVFPGIQRRVDTYYRVDLKIQFMQEIERNRYLTRFDAYIDLPDIIDIFEGLFGYSQFYRYNTREYFWDENLQKHPVALEQFTQSIGIKLGFRF